MSGDSPRKEDQPFRHCAGRGRVARVGDDEAGHRPRGPSTL